jgi:hypothetical protein
MAASSFGHPDWDSDHNQKELRIAKWIGGASEVNRCELRRLSS